MRDRIISVLNGIRNTLTPDNLNDLFRNLRSEEHTSELQSRI